MVSERGIEVDPQKIKAIQEMEPPKTEKQIQGFLGKVQYLRRFIAHLTMTCEPIFKLLKKNSSKKWTEECQQDSGSKKERPVYYISKKMLEYEVKYTILEKTCLALVWATQRLRHYLLSSKKSVKGRVIAEQLADSPVEENAFLKAEFPDEEIMDVEEDTPNTRWAITKNHFADALATLASMLDISATMEIQPLTVRLQWEPAHVNIIEIAARCPDGKPWYTDIMNLISGEGHPPGASGKERKTLQKLAANFVICGNQLYRRSFDGIQLLCVDKDKAVDLIEQTHEGIWGTS
ncbi:uncharacterized protein LOC143878977 [Tasmannia lanceolata]|uniref:uncharacterized protein LOC143878977 n=1 Tax=Tasmannia lanceolata TaxID=3420 RepID=UPI0040640B63